MYQWTGLLNGDDGEPLVSPSDADKTVQIKGTFGVGGAINIEGSNDLTAPTYATLTDSAGVSVAVTSAKIVGILQNPYQLRPRVISGDGTTNLTVTIVIRRAA